MMSAISDLINAKMDDFRKKLEKRSKKTMPYYAIPLGYTIIGFIAEFEKIQF